MFRPTQNLQSRLPSSRRINVIEIYSSRNDETPQPSALSSYIELLCEFVNIGKGKRRGAGAKGEEYSTLRIGLTGWFEMLRTVYISSCNFYRTTKLYERLTQWLKVLIRRLASNFSTYDIFLMCNKHISRVPEYEE